MVGRKSQASRLAVLCFVLTVSATVGMFLGFGSSVSASAAQRLEAAPVSQEGGKVVVSLKPTVAISVTRQYQRDGISGDLDISGTSTDSIADTLERGGIGTDVADSNVSIDEMTDMGDLGVLVSLTRDDRSTEDLLEYAEAIPGIEYAAPVYEVHYMAMNPADEEVLASAVSEGAQQADGNADGPVEDMKMPNDPMMKKTGTAADAPDQYYLYNSHVTDAWQQGAASDGKVTVAVLDSGAAINHLELKANVLGDQAYDAGNKQSLRQTFAEFGFYDGDTEDGHGTHVSGIVGAVADNSIGIAGASYNAKILPIKVRKTTKDAATGKITSKMDTMDITNAVNALMNMIDQGTVKNVRVVNMSIGTASDEPFPYMTAALKKAKEQYGLAIVCAGGNGDEKGNPRTTPVYPADDPSCYSVTALDKDNANTSWSDYNMEKDISAPGVRIWSTVPDTPAKEDGDTSLKAMDGTSMASPLVSGIAALMFASVPEAKPDDVFEAMSKTADPVSTAQNDRTGKTGSAGAVNAAKAISYLEDKYAKEPSVVTTSLASSVSTFLTGDTIHLTGTYKVDGADLETSKVTNDILYNGRTLSSVTISGTQITLDKVFHPVVSTLSAKIDGKAVTGATMADDGTITGLGTISKGSTLTIEYDVMTGDNVKGNFPAGDKLTFKTSISSNNRLTGTFDASAEAVIRKRDNTNTNTNTNENTNENTNSNSNTNMNTNTNGNSNTSTNMNSNSNSNGNTNSNANTNTNTNGGGGSDDPLKGLTGVSFTLGGRTFEGFDPSIKTYKVEGKRPSSWKVSGFSLPYTKASFSTTDASIICTLTNDDGSIHTVYTFNYTEPSSDGNQDARTNSNANNAKDGNGTGQGNGDATDDMHQAPTNRNEANGASPTRQSPDSGDANGTETLLQTGDAVPVTALLLGANAVVIVLALMASKALRRR